MNTTPESAHAVQALLSLPFLVIGLSHLLQPRMWIDFFYYLHGLGAPGVVIRTFGLEFLPAMAITTFHWVWSWPEALLSIYGVLLTLKVIIGLLAPSIGLRSLALADQKGPFPLQIAGGLLVALAAICFWGMLG